MQIVIIEDEKLAANYLEKMILKFDNNIKVLAKPESVEEAITWFTTHKEPDLIFLDIHLEDGLSFSIFEKVSVKSPIIFTTAYDEYAIKAFSLKSIDYLLKPIQQEELNRSIEKYREWNSANTKEINIQELYDLLSAKNPNYKERFSIHVGQKIRTISVDDIAYFYSEESITFVVTNDKAEYALDYSLEELGEMLNPKDFFRINRQYLIKLKAIKNIHVFPKSRLKIELNPPAAKEVFVSIDKITRFKQWLNT
ncbi:MAG: LytTR family DNA-binding domain-containing protein [Lentimicrobiaceae bacterium]|nr:LytTR family DNA-binding domain-containing protein [Lentimicrobiaceae bacterium]